MLSPARNRYLETWKAFIRLHDEGRERSISASNFMSENLDRTINETGVKPVLNQIELHPRFQQRELRAFHQSRGIATQAWNLLGQGQLLDGRSPINMQ